jgi:uncharacterized membrane protein YqjE
VTSKEQTFLLITLGMLGMAFMAWALFVLTSCVTTNLDCRHRDNWDEPECFGKK